MSKSRNIKRARELRKRKKEREKTEKINFHLEKNQRELSDKAAKEGMLVVDRTSLGKKEKISEVLTRMIKPLLDEAYDEVDARGIIALGATAWNLGIIRSTQGEVQYKKLLKKFKAKEIRDHMDLLQEFIDVKCDYFGEYKNLITDHKVSFDEEGRLYLTVLTNDLTDHP